MRPDHDDHAGDLGARAALGPSAAKVGSLAALNASLCRAVGITDLSTVVGVKVLLGVREYPRVIVTHRLRAGSAVEPVRQAFRLVPIVDEPDERPPP